MSKLVNPLLAIGALSNILYLFLEDSFSLVPPFHPAEEEILNLISLPTIEFDEFQTTITKVHAGFWSVSPRLQSADLRNNSSVGKFVWFLFIRNQTSFPTEELKMFSNQLMVLNRSIVSSYIALGCSFVQ